MAFRWSGWLPVVRPRLSAFLSDAQALERLHAAGRQLPGSSRGALEVRLAAGPAPIDLSVRLLEPDQGREVSGHVASPALREFLRRWSERDPDLAAFRSVWLELDLDRQPSILLNPVVAVKLPPDAGLGWIVDVLVPALRGEPLAGDQRDLIASCHGAIPTPGFLLYVFDLSPRGVGAVRLEIFGLAPAGIVGYLRRIAPESADRVGEVAALFEGVERLHLSIDVGSEVLPRIGIEGSFPRLPRREPRWAELFDRLVDRGLCTPEKRDAALTWPGYDTFWTAPGEWPVAEAGAGGFCARTLSHVKVVSRPDREPEAKAYLMAGPLFKADGPRLTSTRSNQG